MFCQPGQRYSALNIPSTGTLYQGAFGDEEDEPYDDADKQAEWLPGIELHADLFKPVRQ
mgnify:CR=1 FL=1